MGNAGSTTVTTNHGTALEALHQSTGAAGQGGKEGGVGDGGQHGEGIAPLPARRLGEDRGKLDADVQCGGQGGAGAACALARQMEDLEGADLARMDDSDPDGIQPGDDVGHIARRNGDRSGVERHR